MIVLTEAGRPARCEWQGFLKGLLNNTGVEEARGAPACTLWSILRFTLDAMCPAGSNYYKMAPHSPKVTGL